MSRYVLRPSPLLPLIPAKAGIGEQQGIVRRAAMDSRFRGNERSVRLDAIQC
jgi:hypothetical protein